MSEKKERLDVLLHSSGYAESREKAKALIMSGIVYVNGGKTDKPGSRVPVSAVLELRGNTCPFVSRGGYKLEKAAETFGIDFRGKTVADIGASTGGFTDCALQRGASKVYAVDVGYGQLDWKLRTDERVVVMEKTNARYLEADSFEGGVDIVTVDVAFISLKKIFPSIRKILREGGTAAALIKPQFEAGRDKVGKKGVVRDPAVHIEVIEGVLEAAGQNGFFVKGLTFSPVRGPEGNIEYLVELSAGRPGGDAVEPPMAGNVVREAFAALKN